MSVLRTLPPRRVRVTRPTRGTAGSGVAGVGDPSVLLEQAGLLDLSQGPQDRREVLGRGQGLRVFRAKYPASASQGVLLNGAGLLVLAQLVQREGEVVGGPERVGVVVTQH